MLHQIFAPVKLEWSVVCCMGPEKRGTSWMSTSFWDITLFCASFKSTVIWLHHQSWRASEERKQQKQVVTKLHANCSAYSSTPEIEAWSLAFWLSHQYPIRIPRLPHSYFMPCPSHPPWLDHSNYVWRGVQVMKLLIMQFSPISFYIIPLRSKNILLSTLFSNTLSLCSSLNVK
jgi:hypothetical protein